MSSASRDTRFYTLRVWDDEAWGGVWRQARGWWFRFGRDGWGLAYKNIAKTGHHPLFTERYGRDRSVALRVGPHIWTVLRPNRREKVMGDG